MRPVKILDERRSPNPRRVRVFLDEKGIEIPYEQVDMVAGAHKSPEFTAINPAQSLPVLILEDGTALSESIAICRYFEALHPEPNLFGRTPLEMAKVEMWNRRAEIHLFFTVAQVFRHSHPAMAMLENPQVPAWAELNRPRVAKAIGLFDGHLANSRHPAGDNYSVADITALIAAQFMKPARLPIPEEAVHFKRWFEEVSQRPASVFKG
jgi:glutathione S-transferase